MAFNLRYVEYPASPDREFPCDYCALSFDRQHDLKRHIETHSGEKPYLCDRGCGKAFTRKDALKRHQTTFPFCPPVRGPPPAAPVTPEPPSRIHPQSAGIPSSEYPGGFPPASHYSAAGASTAYSSGFSSALPYGSVPPPTSKYNTSPPPMPSQYGGGSSIAPHYGSGKSLYEGTSYSSRYGPGSLPHTPHDPAFVPPPLDGGDFPASPARPYPCDICSLSFDRHHDLKRHRGTHAGERPYLCNGCEKTFTRKDALKRHQLSKECGRVEP